YNNQGFAYLINQQGDVLLRPSEHGEDDIQENIFAMFGDSESDRELLAIFQESMSRHETGSGVLNVKSRKKDYIYTYVPIENVTGWYLVSIVSEGAIMDEANRIVSSSQVVIVVAIVVMAVLFVFVFFMWRARRELLKKEQEKEYREEQFRTLANYLANNTDDAYIMLREDRKSVEYASPNFERVRGIAAEDAPNSLRILDHDSDELDGLKANESLQSVELEMNDPSTGKCKWFQETVYCAYIQGEKKYIIYISDRTKEREVQNNLRTALDAAREANQAKSSFLSSVSHDIRTPMNAIIGLNVLLQQEADNPKSVMEYAKKLEASSQYLLGLLNDILDMNKIESGKMMLYTEEIDLAEVIERLNSIIRPQVKAKEQSMEIYTSGFRHEHLLGDKTRINQIFINILSNAVKYTPKGGRIEMTVNELPQISEGFSRIQFKIKDNGQGMSEEYQKIIFDPFTREQNTTINEVQGTGLGMAITKNLVELMGGKLTVASKPGEGSEFTVEINLRIQEKEDDSAFWKEHNIRRIIVADDDKEICENVVRAMTEKGVHVDYVTEGENVIRTIQAAKERQEPYDLLLLDWKLSDLSGLEVARILRKDYSEKIPIMLFTAYDWTDIEKDALEAGIDHFMPKPFFISTFKESIKRVMYKTSSGADVAQQTEESIVKDKHILMVEDNKVNRFILQKILTSRGATYDVAENGQEAVDMFEASRPGEYDFVLMDVKMPVMDGYQATRAIRAGSHPCAETIPIIAMTANAFVDDVMDALESGMDAHVAKPIILEVLENTIKEVLDRKKM
ncbi:MAG: response regulator, partial [Lachnospiraceae bacterium]|nr:response regulator [Lachnospiraceae bacterium]